MADLSLHSHSTNFAQWSSRKVHTDWEDEIRVGLVGEGNPGSATALPKLRQQGLEKGNQVKSLSIQKSTASCSPLHLFFTLGQDFLQTSVSMCGSHGGDQKKRGSIRCSQGWWNQRLCGSFSYATLGLPRTSRYRCCPLNRFEQ